MEATAAKRRGDTAVLRPLFMQVYLPNLILATGQGAILPILALAATERHASLWVAGVIVSVNAFGTMLFDIPSGWVVNRLGEAGASWVAFVLLVAGVVGVLLTRDLAGLAIGVFVASCGWAVWSLVRLTHLSRITPIGVRGRALSIFGGVMRAGQVLGPFIALFVGLFATVHGAFLVDTSFVIYLVSIVIGFAMLNWRRDRTDTGSFAREPQRVHPVRVVREHKHEFATAGVGTLGISLLRGSRQVIIPLWGYHVGLSKSEVELIFGLSSLVDLSLFYPSGIISDRFGRRAVAVPCLVLLSLGHIAMPFTHTFTTVFLAAVLLSIGNGLGSGIVMTLGADRAPREGRAGFLSVWRLVSDTGTTAGPLLDSALIALVSLSFACPVMELIGLAAAVVVGVGLEEPSDLAATAAAAGP